MTRFRVSLFAPLALCLIVPAGIIRAQAPPTVPPPASTLLPAPAAASPSPRALAFLEQVTAHFAEWDRDGNKELSKAEIDLVVADPKTTGKSAAAIASLKRAMRSTRYTMPALTQDNIRQLALAAPDATRPNLGTSYASALTKINKAKRSLFESGLPRLETVHQGRLGDCFCLAPLGAMLYRDPKQVAGMFQMQPDKTVCVAFGPKTVRVEAPTDAEMALSSSTEADGVWVNLYEKAVGQVRNEGRPSDKQEPALDAISRGGSAGTMLQTITGHKIQRLSCRFAKDAKLSEADKEAKLKEMREKLVAAQSEKRLMTCGTAKPTTPGITPNHAYAVLGYDAATDEIRLWNPHGNGFTPKGAPGLEHGYPRAKGIFSLPLKEFVAQFTGLAFETAEAVE